MNRVLQGPSDILSLCKLNYSDQVAVIGKRGKGHPVTDNNNPYSTLHASQLPGSIPVT